MRRSVWLAAWCAPALLASAMTADASAAAAKKKEEPKQQAATAAPTAVKPGESGLVVIRDREPGELRAPEAGDLLEAVPANNHPDEGLVDVQHPRGGYSRDLQGRFQEYFVVTRGADGTLKRVCVNDPAQAELLAKRQPAPPATASAQGEDR